MRLVMEYVWPDTWGDISAHVLRVVGLRAQYDPPVPGQALIARPVQFPPTEHVRCCADCGLPFDRTAGQQRYCLDCGTPVARNRRSRLRRSLHTAPQLTEIRPCIDCGQPFRATHGNQRKCPRHGWQM